MVVTLANALPSRAGEAQRPDAITLRRWSFAPPRVIVVGASTGGPQALTAFLRALAPSRDGIPLIVVLHMPPAFVAPMCLDVARQTGLPASVARHGEAVLSGGVYFAAGPAHCTVVTLGEEPFFASSDAPAVNFCKPAVDMLFRSAADTFGAGTLGVMLTGMGHDGLAGSHAVVAAGGTVVAQDERSSTVWGMPGAVAREGLCSAVQPPESLALTIAARLRRFGVEHRR